MKIAPDFRAGTVYVASRLVADAERTFAPGALAVSDGDRKASMGPAATGTACPVR
jgi:hypothetical protein